MTSSILFAAAVMIGAPAPKEGPKEAPRIEGDWIVESFEGPKDGPPGAITFRITDSKISIIEAKRDKPEEASYTVDLKKNPATIDIRPGRGQKDQVVLGIIEIKGDTMKLCFTKEGGERPKEFKGDAANGVMLINLKRIKSEK
jgi:uncharacterized protein (TIGR03067 family)